MMSSPEKDKVSTTREYLLARVAIALGGRIAEEIFMDQMTTGASSDFESATEMAHNMVSRWGMSDELGTRVYASNQHEEMSSGVKMSNQTANLIDTEVSRILTEQYDRAKKILEDNRDIVELMADSLMEYETLDADQIADVMKGIRPTPPSDMPKPKNPSNKDDSDVNGKPAVKPQIDKPIADS